MLKIETMWYMFSDFKKRIKLKIKISNKMISGKSP